MVKTYEQFLNENLAGEYCYFGSNALIPIAMKLHNEGMNAKQIYDYLTSLGVQERQKMFIINSLTSDGVLEGVDDLVSADIEDEIADMKKKKDDNGEEKDDKESDSEEEKDDEKEEDETDSSKETEILKKVLKDQEKLDQIRAILKEKKKAPSDDVKT